MAGHGRYVEVYITARTCRLDFSPLRPFNRSTPLYRSFNRSHKLFPSELRLCSANRQSRPRKPDTLNDLREDHPMSHIVSKMD